MAWIRVVPPAKAEGDLERVYARLKDSSGGVANILTVHSLHPAALQAHYDLYRVVMFGPSELTRAQREMVGVVVSKTNGCHY